MKLYIAQFTGKKEERIVLWENKPNVADVAEYQDASCPLAQIVECDVISGNITALPLDRSMVAE